MLTSRLPLLPVLLFFCAITAAGQSGSVQYTVTDLGDFSAKALNNSATVVGTKVPGSSRAVLFRNGVLTEIIPAGAVSSVANGINDLDQVVGYIDICDMVNGNCVNSRHRAFIFEKGTFTILGTLGGRHSEAYGINNTGQIVGWSHTPGPPPGNVGDEHAFIFQNGVFEDLGAKLTGGNSFASSINANGQVSGWGLSATSLNGPFLYSGGLFEFFTTNGLAWDINNTAQVVGGLSGNDDGTGRAFLFSSGVLRDLGKPSPEQKYAIASAINNVGQVVGFASPRFLSSDGERAFIFNGGIIEDLNSLISANSGWVLSRAVDINDAGQIVGNGFKDGLPRAFLLTPTQPLLITEPNSTKAIVVETIWYLRDPFGLQTPVILGPDQRTRLTIVARNIEVIAGENIAPLTVRAEDAQHRLIDLPVEFIGKIPSAPWLTQITVRLPDQLNAAGETQLRISFRGQTSNPGSIFIAPNP